MKTIYLLVPLWIGSLAAGCDANRKERPFGDPLSRGLPPPGDTDGFAGGGESSALSLTGHNEVSLSDAQRKGQADARVTIQAAIDSLRGGGGTVYVPPGRYRLSAPLKLRSRVILEGAGQGTQFLQEGIAAISQDDGEYVVYSGVRKLRIVFQDPSAADRSRSALLLRAHSYSVFENLAFEGFGNQIVIKIQPTVRPTPGQGVQLVSFNTFRNWEVTSCNIGVWYEGLGDFDANGRATFPVVPITNNSWYDIAFRRVTQGGSAIYGVQWADAERWYSLHASAWGTNVTLVNLNVDDVFKQIDHFQFYGAVLQYSDAAVGEPHTLTAVRFGPETFANVFQGLVVDNFWATTDPVSGVRTRAKVINDQHSDNYFIQYVKLGEGHHVGPGILTKGMSTSRSGEATVVARSNKVYVQHHLRRTPELHEISVTPSGDLGDSSFWISGANSRHFIINVSKISDRDRSFVWRAELGPYDLPVGYESDPSSR